jgi:poly(A) polymerase
VVGGAVRDALLGRKVGDIDLATTLPPEHVMDILAKAGFKTVPTGIAHGTITAVVDHIGYEITTLRRDVETDGRHAQVAFTDNWREDAARRDFTFNALYVDAERNLYDYFNGVEDAKAGRVRFIGDARARIREDVLRILRFFRFYAFFGKGDADAEALAACRELANLIPNLSAERIAHEFTKLLAAENPLPALQLMNDCGVTRQFLPEVSDLSRLYALLETEKRYGIAPMALVRFAATLPSDGKIASAVAARLKLSNRDAETLRGLAELPNLLRDNRTPAALRRMINQYGKENCRAAMLLNGREISDALATIAAWESPVFPIKGEDIVKLGLPQGPRIGEILRAVEKWWISGDFRADRTACLEQARQYGKNH